MSENQRQDTSTKDKLQDIIRSLLGGETTTTSSSDGIISGVDFGKLIEWILSEKPEAKIVEEKITELKEQLLQINSISRDLVDVMSKDGLARIVHPRYGYDIIKIRLAQTLELLRLLIRNSWHRVRLAVRNNEPPERVYQLAREAETISRYASLIAVELALRLQTLFFMNAPAKTRPPLVNVALGYDILKP